MPQKFLKQYVNLRPYDCISARSDQTSQAVTALAGFYVGEPYSVPWATVEVPTELQIKVFPFVEGALANMQANGCTNQGTINFLELLQELRPFFWRVRVCLG